MVRYILKRLLLAIPTLVGIVLISFIFLRAIPGNPAHVLVGERSSPEIIAAYEEKLGLNLPIVAQFSKYLWATVQGDLGMSYFTGQPVGESLLRKFPNTLRLALAAMFYAFLIGTLLGLLSAVYRETWIDRLLLFVSILGLSLPVFWVGILLILGFAIFLPLLPPSGMGGGHWSYLILPALTLGTHTAAATLRMARTCFLQVLREKYIQTARAKGLSPARVLLFHVLKNAMIPIVTLVGLDFGSMLGGAVLTETVFGWDGIGRFAVDGLFKRDYPVILGTILFGAVVFVLVNLLIDLIYAYLDPRIEHQ